ncbi:MAG: FG-GAP repeat protein, partial [Phycisphaerales bacterium]|nr:FG-GAP repeat protein [Phycisphaerales bacterium]
FGLGIDNGLVVVGSYGDDDNGLSSGSAYLFDAATGDQLNKCLPSDGEQYENFGLSAAIENGVVAIAARYDNDNGNGSGSAYVFNLGPAGPCNDADLAEPFGLLDLADINAFVAAFLAGDPAADLDGNGLHDLQDVIAFGAAFLGGCP